MTIGQAKQIIRFLLDGELYNAYEHKLNTFLDLGQKRIACTTDFLEREQEMRVDQTRDVDLEQMDERFYRLRRIEGGEWEKLTPTRVRLQPGEYRILYNIYPLTITPHTGDEVEFEISEAAQTALPYFAAAQVTAQEHDLRYRQIYYDEFAAILENVDAARRTGNIRVLSKEGGGL